MTQLRTLGTLALEGVAFSREKPLLLLAYLCLNGQQGRRSVARKFWPDASNPMNSLSVALGQLRKVTPDAFHATETHVRSDLSCDALDLQRALEHGDVGAARLLYRGVFLPDLTTEELGEELEEWVMHTREALADGLRTLLIREARAQLPVNPAQAAAHAAGAFQLPGVTPPNLDLLRELHALLSATGHADAPKVAQEAAELGVTLHAVPTAPTVSLLGRHAELERLRGVQSGETLWLRGAPGLGKTALLRAAATGGGTLLGARSGKPYQTLTPLAPDHPPDTERAWLDLLGQYPAPLLIDGWEACDPESRRALLAHARTHAGGPLIIASRERPPADLPELQLRPITLTDPEQEQRTGGLPALLHADMQGTPLADAYAALLGPLSPRARQLLACLAVQNTPERQATCAALNLSADDMAELLETLARAHLLRDTSPTAPAAARAWLDTQPTLETEVLTLLAPHLTPEDALPLYLRAHDLTGSSDFPGFQDVLEKHARTLLEAGRDNQAEALLATHALTETNQLLHGRALDALGRYPEALKRLGTLEKTPLVQAYRGRVLFRLGQTTEAEAAAHEALTGDLEARAQAYNLLGALALAGRKYVEAKSCFEKATGLLLAYGGELNYLNGLCNLAVAMTELGDNTDLVMSEIYSLAEKHNHPQTLLNIGWLLDRQGNPESSIKYTEKAAQFAEQEHQIATASSAWNNIGVLYHQTGDLNSARAAYQNAIRLAKQSQETRFLALALGNLAELVESLPLIEEALGILAGSGHDDLVAYFEEQRRVFMGRSGGG